MSSQIPELDLKGLRNFGLTTGAIIAGLFGLFFPWVFGASLPKWPWIFAGALWLPALLVPGALRPVYKGWMKFAHVLGAVNTRIILAVLFYLIVLPLGLLMRLFGKDPMARKLGEPVASYRVKSVSHPKDQLEKPY